MTTATDLLEGQASLFDAPELDITPAGQHLVCSAGSPGRGAGAAEAPEPPLDPSRWVVVGWRDAKGVTFTREQILAVLNNTTQGSCVGCGALHHRYGDGGQPYCSACRSA